MDTFQAIALKECCFHHRMAPFDAFTSRLTLLWRLEVRDSEFDSQWSFGVRPRTSPDPSRECRAASSEFGRFADGVTFL